MRLAVPILGMITPWVFCTAVRKGDLFPRVPVSGPIPVSEQIPVPEPTPLFDTIPVTKPIPLSEPIQAFKPTPPYENVPVGTPTTTRKTESAPSWAFKWCNLPEGLNIWNLLGILVSSLLICLMEYRLRRSRRREDNAKEELSEVRMRLEESERYILQLRDMAPLFKEMEEKILAQFQNLENSTKIVTEVEFERCPQFQNEMSSMNTMIERLPLVPTEQAPMVPPAKMATPRKYYTVASKATGERKNSNQQRELNTHISEQ
jgi:hypothetical protein